MAIESTRIDDRLIHGQVASSWLSYVGAEQIICVNDEAKNNPVQAQVLKMAAPGYIVHLFGVEQFVNICKKNPIKKSTFLILGSTKDLLTLVEGGVEISRVNFGGMRPSKERDISFKPDLCFTQEELDAVKKLEEHNVKMDYQVAAYDAPENFYKYLEKAKKEA